MSLVTAILKPIGAVEQIYIGARDGSITVYDYPVSSGWRWSEDSRREEERIVKSVRCRYSDGHRQLLLYAKDNEMIEIPESVDHLVGRNWRKHYAFLFSRVDKLSVHRATESLVGEIVPALEISVEGESKRGPLRLRERFTPVPGHLLVVAALGAPMLFGYLEPDVERWFDSVEFDPF
jgi:hypothetical protein